MMYYCEVLNCLEIEPDMQGEFADDTSAIEFFQGKFPAKIQYIYDDSFRAIYEDKTLIDDNPV